MFNVLVDRFLYIYIALFFTLEQTHCTHMSLYMAGAM